MQQYPPASLSGPTTDPPGFAQPAPGFAGMNAGQQGMPVPRTGMPTPIPALPQNHRLARGKVAGMGREMGEDYQPTEVVPALGRRLGWRVPALGAALAIILGLGGGYLIWGKESPPSALEATSHANQLDAAGKPSTSIAASNRDSRGGPSTSTGQPDNPEISDANPASAVSGQQNTDASPANPSVLPASGQCRAHIVAIPRGTEVYLARRQLGVTPFDTTLPCGESTLRFERRRYQTLTRKVELTTGQQNEVTIKLDRPPVSLKVTSVPSGATVTLSGKALGQTPLSVDIDGYVRADIVVSLPGYQPFQKRVTPKPPRLVIQAKLRRAGR